MGTKTHPEPYKEVLSRAVDVQTPAEFFNLIKVSA
jgi:hypothetical protein